MKKTSTPLNLIKYFTFVFVSMALTSCNLSKMDGLVPSEWTHIPEKGALVKSGSEEKLGVEVQKIFSDYSESFNNLPEEKIGLSENKTKTVKPVDWVPWHLALISADFGISSEGVFGALVGAGTASVRATWKRNEAQKTQPPPHLTPFSSVSKSSVSAGESSFAMPTSFAAENPPEHSEVKLMGFASKKSVDSQIESIIEKSLKDKKVTNEDQFRKTVRKVADDFRDMALALNVLSIEKTQFRPSAFRLEITIGADGQVTPVIGVGGSVFLRFDWIIDRHESDHFKNFNPINHRWSKPALKLIQFANSIAPDIDAVKDSVPEIKKAGFEMSYVRAGLVFSASYDFAVASVEGEAVASIKFGDNGGEGGCEDPDGDGDCHNSLMQQGFKLTDYLSDKGLLDSTSLADGIPLVKRVNPTQLALSGFNTSIGTLSDAKVGDGSDTLKSTIIPHKRLQAGLKRAMKLSSFFLKHAAKAKPGKWKLDEIETEFELSLTGSVGLASVGAGAELAIEFERKN